MKTEVEVEEFKSRARSEYIVGCKLCAAGADPECSCHAKEAIAIAAFEACVPRDFWTVTADDVRYNKEAFESLVQRYAAQTRKALGRGYGLLFLGANGVGKSMFVSYVLMEAIRAGRTAYYTTLPQLDYNLKRGFNDPEAQQRLDWMLTSDFVAIDEVGKEYIKSDSGSWIKTQLERILKARFDDSMPVLLATNMDYAELSKVYGPTMESIFNGKYQQVAMLPGDFREKLRKKMERDMGY